jgi:glycosyltransferase involved in cell wall biosynthesis
LELSRRNAGNDIDLTAKTSAKTIMRIALIATVFNEGEDIFRWAESIRKQTLQPDEFVVVDGGSTDGTPERLKKAFSHGDFPPPRIIVEKCNIARGRNLAIRNTTAEIVASSDASSYPEPGWLAQITRPLLENPSVDAVGGKTIVISENAFQAFLLEMEGQPPDDDGYYPSSRNLALRRGAWESVGGYPEWLTLAAEDALYNFELHAVGKKFACNNEALVRWSIRPTPEAYYKLLWRNAFGAAEAQLYTPYFLKKLAVALVPILLLLSRHRFRHLKFRWRKNAASAFGWVAGKMRGRRPPPGWKKRDGILLSPEALARLDSRRQIS